MYPEHTQSTPSPIARSIGKVRKQLLVDLLALVAVLGMFSFLALQMAPFIPDDSFISFRYAEHLAAGEGLRFNPDEQPVEGYSNFLWIIILASLTRLSVGLEATSAFLGGLLGLLTIGTFWLILRRRGRSGVDLVVPTGLLALSAPFILYAVSGMETILFSFLLLAVMLAVDSLMTRPSAVWAVALGLLASLAALTRPEGVLALPVVLICMLALKWQSGPQRRAIIRAAAIAALVFILTQAVYHGWRVSYFDAVWPTPFLSKGASGSSLIDSWLSNLRQFLLRQSNYYTPQGYYYLAMAIPAVVAVWLAWRRGRRVDVEFIALSLALVYAAVYLNFVDWMPGMRYYTPLVGLFLIPFSLLGSQIDDVNGSHRSWQSHPTFILLAFTLALFSLSSLAAMRLDSQQLQAGTQESMVRLGRWLHETMPPDSVLAMSDVGAAPYYSRLRTIDINPASLTDRHIAEHGWSADYFFERDPDVVALTAFSLAKPDFYGVHEELYHSERFQSVYERIGIVRNDWYQDRSYWVFVRKGAALSPEQLAAFPQGISKP